MFDYIIYDFDGTISDTYPVFAKAFVETAASYNIPVNYDTVYKQLKISVGHALKQYSWNDDMENVKSQFKKNHHRLARQYQEAFPEAKEILQYAIDHGKKNYLYTHTGKFAYEMLAKMGLTQYFEFVLDGSYGFPSKPAPDAFNFLCQKCNIDKNRAIMIGDRDIDVGAAHAAGAKGCLIDTDNLYVDCVVDYRIDSLLDLKHII